MTLEEVVMTAPDGPLFNNAAQAWNHTFFWNGLSPERIKMPERVHNLIRRNFNSIDAFEKEFLKKGTERFASGWLWLVGGQGNLQIETTSNAGNPLRHKRTAFLTCDLWEHAYYIDYRNDRAKFLEAAFQLINWDFVDKNLAQAEATAA
jgi:Fe-Mn family superoxide dismutase